MKKFFKYLSLGLTSLALVFGCFFTTKLSYKKNNVAFADSVVTDYNYTSSNLFIPLDLATSSTGTNLAYLSDSLISFELSASSRLIHFKQFIYSNSLHDVVVYTYDVNASSTPSTTTTNLSYHLTGDHAGYTKFGYKVNNLAFNYNIQSVNFTNLVDGTSAYTLIQFVDSNSNYLQFSFWFRYGSDYYSRALNARSYFLLSPDNLSDSQQYNAGYQQGLSDNQQIVYDNGFSSGRTQGYTAGYNAGVAAANDYSFISLIGAVVDVPVKAITNTLNFSFLGINLLSFITSILTLCIIIKIMNFVLGR